MRSLFLLVMIVVALLVGIISAAVFGWAGGVILALVVFIGWYRINLRAATTGLFKANLNSYFAFRQKGLGVDDALRAMVAARYSFAFQRAKKDTVLLALEELVRIPAAGRVAPSRVVMQPEPETLRVVQAVMIVFGAEHGQPPPELAERYHNEIMALYSRIKARYAPGKK